MPVVRFSRDKRGYEHVYLVQPSVRRGRGSAPPRMLYWFRTPPGVRVGRQPFDHAAQRALEVQNPDLTFDWEQITATSIPAAESEQWRERRRASRPARPHREREAAAPPPRVSASAGEPEGSPEVDPTLAAGSTAASPPTPRRRGKRRRGAKQSLKPSVPSGNEPAAGPAGSETP